MSVLAIDAGTTGVTALVVTKDGKIAAKGYEEFSQHFPKPGWVEHSPEEIWQATLEATRAALDAHDGDPLEVKVGVLERTVADLRVRLDERREARRLEVDALLAELDAARDDLVDRIEMLRLEFGAL